MKIAKLLALGLMLFSATGCILTKIVTVPMRAVGAVVSIIPVAGNKGHDVIDEAADIVDKLPF